MTHPHIPQDPTNPFLTTREAAVLLGVSLRSVQLWVEAGKLHAGCTPGGHRRIRMSAVLALAAGQGLGDPANPLQAQLDAALADGKRLHEAYLGAERELQAARAEIERITELGRAHIRRAAAPEDERDQLRSEVERLRANQIAWVSTCDRPPPPNAWLIVAWGGGCLSVANTFTKWLHPSHKLGYLIQGHPGSHNDVTHWMLLPGTPQSADLSGVIAERAHGIAPSDTLGAQS